MSASLWECNHEDVHTRDTECQTGRQTRLTPFFIVLRNSRVDFKYFMEKINRSERVWHCTRGDKEKREL